MGRAALANTVRLSSLGHGEGVSAMRLMCGAVCCGFLLLAGCGGDSKPNTSITGNWTYAFSLTNGCSGTGQASLTQSGDNFTGQVTNGVYACDDGSGGAANGAITGGTLSGTNVTFTFAGLGELCTHTGTLGNSDDTMQGSVACPGGASGTWSLNR